MRLEKQLIHKEFYKTLLNGEEARNAVGTLAERLLAAQNSLHSPVQAEVHETEQKGASERGYEPESEHNPEQKHNQPLDQYQVNVINLDDEALLEEADDPIDQLEMVPRLRFGQGEVYFHHKDFETAIFKWEQVDDALEPWAKKNIADAYFELGLLDVAEGVYRSVVTDNLVLKTEVTLQLFSLYIEAGQIDSATSAIKKAVAMNPDYPNVTRLARVFFEEHQDWNSAIELAANEAVRSEEVQWFDVLNVYVDRGFAKAIEPNYFDETLLSLFEVDVVRFERLACSLWKVYQEGEYYFTWINGFNRLFATVDLEAGASWQELSALYFETHEQLLYGGFLIKQVKIIVPQLVSNWIRIAEPAHRLIAAASVLAWEDLFQGSISEAGITLAEQQIGQVEEVQDLIENSLSLFESLVNWAGDHDTEVGHRMRWFIHELAEAEGNQVVLTGFDGKAKIGFINSIMGEQILEAPGSAVVVYQHQEEIEVREITDEGAIPVANFSDFYELTAGKRQLESGKRLIEFRWPSKFLQDHRIKLIDTPGLNAWDKRAFAEMKRYAHSASSVLVAVNTAQPVDETQLTVLTHLLQEKPDMQLSFLAVKTGEALNIGYIDSTIDGEIVAGNDEANTEQSQPGPLDVLQAHFPHADFITFDLKQHPKLQLADLAVFLKRGIRTQSGMSSRAAKLLYFVRETIALLLQKRIDMENVLIEAITWNEGMLEKQKAAYLQVSDIEKEKADVIRKMYERIKVEIREDIMTDIPALLKDTVNLIDEDSDFRNIHIGLNEEMNDRIKDYLENKVLVKTYHFMQEWIAASQEEFNQGQYDLVQMEDGFNALFGVDRLRMECDFKVLDDWRRDVDRMTTGVTFEKVNILLRLTPSQLLLKSAGKLFGTIGQNKAMVYNQYKKYLENKDYQELAQSIADKFLLQFELFEKGIDRDISLFFKTPYSELNRVIGEIEAEIEVKNAALDDMRANPEVYHDPLKLFEVRLRELEWMAGANRTIRVMS